MPIDEPIHRHTHKSIVQCFTFSVLFILWKYNRKKLCVTFSTLNLTLTQMRPDVLKSVFFRNLFSPVSDRGPRRTRDDDYNFSLVPLKYSDLFYYPVPKIISNWNSLPLTLKSISDLSDFRSDLKSYFLSKYETICETVGCFSCNN